MKREIGIVNTYASKFGFILVVTPFTTVSPMKILYVVYNVLNTSMLNSYV